MRKESVAVLAGYVAFVGLIFMACGTQGPNNPSLLPSPVPVGPKPVPVGPKPRPIGPSPIGGGPGTPSPSPSPSGGGTPGPTPTPLVPCPPTLTLNAAGTPTLLSSAAADLNLFPTITTNYDSTCQVKQVRVTMRVTTATGFGESPFDTPRAQLGHCGGGSGFSGCSATPLYFFSNGGAVGNSLGSNCSDFVFDTAATTPWNPAALPPPPYSGTYQFDPTRMGAGRPYYLRGLEYDLSYVFDHPDDAVLECMRIDITTQVVQ